MFDSPDIVTRVLVPLGIGAAVTIAAVGVMFLTWVVTLLIDGRRLRRRMREQKARKAYQLRVEEAS